MQADQLIKGDELNCLRLRRCFVQVRFSTHHSNIIFSVTIDRFLTWLADATSAGLRQMCVANIYGNKKTASPVVFL
jgi:hypothetical protein